MSTRESRRFLLTATLAVFIACCAVSTVTAQSAGEGETRNNTINVYLWGASIGGELSFPDGDRSFDVSLEQILYNLKMAGQTLSV